LNYGILTVQKCTISGNHADNGGGGIAQYGSASGTASSLTVINSTISQNTTGGSGAGIADFGASVAGYASTVTVLSSTINGNTASNEGGGISEYSSSLSVINSTIVGNTATYNGGGIGNDYGTLSVTNSTISGNHTTKQGGGIANNAGSVSLGNTIVAKNLADTSDPDCFGAFGDAPGHNFVGAGSSGCTGLVNGFNGDQVGTVAAPFDPLLDSLAQNGGPTQTMALLPGSPAIDHGGTSATGCPATDQRGLPRPDEVSDNGACDIGAYESQHVG
jgi:hypothetical protein